MATASRPVSTASCVAYRSASVARADHVPIWLLLIVVVGAIAGLMLLIVWLVRRFVPAVREGFDAEVLSQMLGVVAALFGLLWRSSS